MTHEDNVILRERPLKLLERRLIRDSAFRVTYHYDLNGILRVTVVDEQTKTVMMDEEMMFGAAQARSQLQLMRRRVDELMDDPTAALSEAAPAAPATTLSPDSLTAVSKARTKVIPVVSKTERSRLEELVRTLENSTPERETANLEALQRELRNHAYLL
ncbi:MAG TPA: hypothetical protein VHV82_11060 [Sporichthyaceae bacterium]|nr:hypothetical protein [Sporichthyaceae bacterium]